MHVNKIKHCGPDFCEQHQDEIHFVKAFFTLEAAISILRHTGPNQAVPLSGRPAFLCVTRAVRRMGSVVCLTGKDKTHLLYAVWSFAEMPGVRFELHGDIIPDPTIELPYARYAHAPLPIENALVTKTPVFAYRGLQPFHDFPEGPDWWDVHMYKHVVHQVSKMKMNFIGLHTYPFSSHDEGYTTATNEPTVWVGTKDQLDDDGRVLSSYTTSYANTMRGGDFGYNALKTSNYSWGASQLFETDCWAPPPTTPASCPFPTTKDAENSLFERVSDMFESVFSMGKALGVESCVGTQTPLSKPPVLPAQPSP